MPLIRKEPAAPDQSSEGGGLGSPEPDERWAAARRMAGRPDAVEALSAALGLETDLRVREALFTALARTGTPAAVAALMPYLRRDDANLRTGALDALRTMPEAASQHASGLLQDPDSDVRILACELARTLPADEATRLLSAVLEHDAEPNVCASAIEVLAEAGEPVALRALERCAERFPDDAFLRFAITLAAARIGGPARA